MSAPLLPPTAEIIAFRRPSRSNRLSLADRLEVAGWAPDARRHGYAKVEFSEWSPGGDPEIGDFVQVYRTGDMWASWGIGIDDGMFTVWSSGSGVTIGRFASMRRALEAIVARPGTVGRPDAALRLCRFGFGNPEGALSAANAPAPSAACAEPG